jgi:glycosyltransferase involved in cell wall biosynthesis
VRAPSSISPLVSIVLPTYNRSHCIHRAVKSVVEQTFTDWELIIVDNSSTDSTLEIISSFSDERIFTFDIENNGIVAKSRNLGIQLSQGKYIALLDSDDWWKPEKLEISLRALELGSDLVYHDLYVISKLPIKANKYSLAATRVLTCPVFNDLLSNGNAITNSSVVVRRDFLQEIGGFSEERDLLGSEDFDGWLRISKHTEKFERLEIILGYYWEGGGNLTTPSSTLKNNLFLSNKYKVDLRIIQRGNLPYWMVYQLARDSFKLEDFDEARKYALLAVKSNAPNKIRLKAVIIWVFSALKF